jgi:hypothetical protein
MVHPLSKRASGASNLTAKNRVWDFFGKSNRTRPANRREALKLRRKNRPTLTKTASGIPVWPSRDPIGEEGGINLYGFCYNDSYGWYDYLGREPQKHDQLPPQSEIDKHGYDRSREAREKTKDSHKEIGGDAKYYRREYCGIICCKNGEVKSSKPHGGTRPTWKMDKAGMQQTGQSTCDPFFNVDKNQVVTCVTEFGEGWKFVAGYHSHTKAGGFSKKRPGENIVTDEDWASTYGDLYLGDPSGDVFRMDKKGNEFQIILDKEGNVNGVPVTK